MQKKILVFGGSTSSKSINVQLAGLAAELVTEHSVTILNLRDYPLPLYCLDIEIGDGAPPNVQKLVDIFAEHDGFLISVPEHNSSFPAVFKNTVDWMSRVGKRFFANKPVALLSATPGRGGGKWSRESTERLLSGFVSGRVVGSLGVPQFQQITEQDEFGKLQFSDQEVKSKVQELVKQLEAELSQSELKE